jgi:hypothetical protein
MACADLNVLRAGNDEGRARASRGHARAELAMSRQPRWAGSKLHRGRTPGQSRGPRWGQGTPRQAPPGRGCARGGTLKGKGPQPFPIIDFGV